ncbi:MAG TPA: lamin tail domain-containing protein, partial [Verrucomicrobiae bacterium]
IAEGTAASPILFTRSAASGNWGNITFNGAIGSPESRLAYARFIHNVTNTGTPCLQVSAGTVNFDHLTFVNTSSPYIHVDGASFVISHCEFPGNTASFEPVHGNGVIKSGGRGIFYRNWWGFTVNGSSYNDSVDFTGGNRPGQPIVQFIDNVFAGSQDDLLDLDGTDAWVEGNIFLHAHRQNGSPDSASAVSGGNDAGNTSEVTILNNIFFDVDQAATAKQLNFYTFINNTVVHQSGAGFDDAGVTAVLNFADETIAQARGMYVEGNILYDIERITRNVTNGTTVANNTTFNGNLMPFAWAGPGASNDTTAPVFNHIPTLAETTNFTNWASAQVMREWFTLAQGSPGHATGPNGTDKGGAVPIGANVSVQPGVTTNDAILVVGVNRSGGTITASGGFPNGSGYTHYKWRIDGGAWSVETPIATPINLPGFKSGAHRVDVSGRRDSGTYQDDADLGELATVTSVFSGGGAQAIRINEVLASNQAAEPHEGTFPDIIELYNPASTGVDIGGLRLTDDLTDPDKFTFPAGVIVPAGGHLVVYANNDDGTSGIHLGFSLNKDGQVLALYDSIDRGGLLIDTVTFGLQLTDYSIGRVGTNWTLCTPTAGGPNVAAAAGVASRLLINEILAAEISAFPDDFVEIHNPQTVPVAMGGLFFTDNPAHWPNRSPVPALSFIAAGGYIAFHADGDVEDGADHLSFSLAAERGLLALLNTDFSVIDCYLYGPQTTDISQGRVVNNIFDNNFFTTPTPGAPNPGLVFTNTGVVINEVLANNGGIAELDGSKPDWVEFFNNAGTNVDMSDYSFTDDSLVPRKYVFPPGSVIAGQGRLRVRCDANIPAGSTN